MMNSKFFIVTISANAILNSPTIFWKTLELELFTIFALMLKTGLKLLSQNFQYLTNIFRRLCKFLASLVFQDNFAVLFLLSGCFAVYLMGYSKQILIPHELK